MRLADDYGDRLIFLLGGSGGHSQGGAVIEFERQALRAAACLLEFRELGLEDAVAGVVEALAQAARARTHHDGVVEVDAIARELQGVIDPDFDEVIRADCTAQERLSVRAKRVHVCHDVPASQRAERGVQMIEALVDEQERHYAATDEFLQLQRRAALAAKTISGIENRSHAIEERITRSLLAKGTTSSPDR